jgi:heterodisulfide reductase subunit A-like polyferredoxin
MGSSEKVGSVLVVGGGVAGIQASLDLAESGFFVYLAERGPSIGGAMSQLDKTFPTNDCAMCILSPKMVQCARDINIDLLTLTEIESVSGEAGRFTVRLRRRPRFVLEKECNGCGDCITACPVRIAGYLDCRLGGHKAIDRPYAQAVPNIVAVEKQKRPPCQMACPVGQNAQGYLALIRAGKYREAMNLIREANPFPAVCGYVCHHPCEAACERGRFDDPIAIRALKRFAVDKAAEMGAAPEQPASTIQEQDTCATPKRVAIIGAGPAGLAAANRLARQGHSVTVFEASDVVGGMLRLGIPEFRLPRHLVDADIAAIRALGVEIRTGMRLDHNVSLDGLFREGYRAVFIAIGAYKGSRLGVEGENLEGVEIGLDFIRRYNLGQKVTVGRRVAVIGGGNAAVDVARVAKRLGAEEVTIVYRRTRHEMPADALEVADALREGVQIRFLTLPTRVVGNNGRVTGIECVRMKLSDKRDSSGRYAPVPIEGSEHILPLDTVLAAIGQSPDTGFAGEGPLRVSRWGSIEVDPETLQTSREGVFAGGDVVVGAGTLVEAIAAGQRAAEAIGRCLGGETLPEPKLQAGQAGPKRPQWSEEDRAQFEARLADAGIAPGERVALPHGGYTEEMAQREAARCLNCGLCCECMECVRACKRNAIDHQQREERFDVEVGAIILAPGYDAFDAKTQSEFGFGRHANVLTGLQFERMLSASGPTLGHLCRPSDHKPPRRVAFIQCVGSRNMTRRGHEYCSSVCCTYAVKQATVAREHDPAVEATIFYMDMRTFGKDFDKYYERARQAGIRFVRSAVSAVEQVPETGNLLVSYVSERDRAQSEEFDLVILSVGLEPARGAVELARAAGIELGDHGFCATAPADPLRTSRPGIFACGVFGGPKDIPESVMEASGAASYAAVLLAEARGTRVEPRTYPPERNVSGIEPRIGVFVCHCGINIAGVVDVAEVAGYASQLRDVVYAETNLYTCSQDSQERIRHLIAEHEINRLVVASCSPRTHEPLFQETARQTGLNRHLVEMANIRDQCSWVHAADPRAATQKAKDLVRMAVARARLAQPLEAQTFPVSKKALIVGGGLAGATAALAIADAGFDAFLVEKQAELGGNLRRLGPTVEGIRPPELLADLEERIANHERIRVFTQAEIESVEGFVGNFKTTLRAVGNGSTAQIEHGVAILAIGGDESRPTEYLYGADPRVMTQLEFEAELDQAPVQVPNRIVMIQCVGSREAGHLYCSRVCCAAAIHNALRARLLNPNAEIHILYRDIRTYAFYEKAYREAREQGIRFVRYDENEKPRVASENGKLRVEVRDPILGRTLAFHPDRLVLSARIDAPADGEALAQLFKVPLNEDRFFLEAHVKLRPVDFATEGVFVAGLAHGPKPIRAAIAQARAAAGRAMTILSRDKCEAPATVSFVLSNRCMACGQCETLCAFGAISIDVAKGAAVVNEALCKGCGACAASCRSSAVFVRGSSDPQIWTMIEAFAETE